LNIEYNYIMLNCACHFENTLEVDKVRCCWKTN